MVKKAVAHVGASFGWDEKTTAELFEGKVAPTMAWNRKVGNAYTAALWLSVASVLAGAEEGTRIAAFSYGAGYGAELFGLTAGPDAAAGAWKADIDEDLAARQVIDAAAYTALRAGG